MSELSTFNTAPYFDDYDEDKKFYKILFRPGVSVQARELTQLQTIIQKQIQRHGDNIFKDGAMVIPGQTSVDTGYAYVKVQNSYNGTLVSSYSQTLEGKVLQGATTGVTALVTKVVHTDTTDPETVFVKYLSSGTDTTTKVFANGENLIPTDPAFASLGLQAAASAATGFGSAASIEKGVYYVGGFFVLVDAQTIILDKYSQTPSYRIGLNIDSFVVDSEDDESLLDNALGSYNYSAPGAHRQSIELTLDKRVQGSTDDADFIQLISVVDGKVQQLVTKTDYNVLENTLARRTYDESGDYTVRPFTLDVREHRNNNRGAWTASKAYEIGDIVTANSKFYSAKSTGVSSTTAPSHTSGDATDGTVVWTYTTDPAYNRGVFTPEQGGDSTLLALGLEPGKAYVRGFEIEKVGTEYLPVPKARDIQSASNAKIAATVGNYVLVKNASGLPKIDQFSTVTLYDQLTASTGTAAGSAIGTARVRSFEYDSGTAGTSATVYKLSLFDVKMNSGKDFAKDVKQFFINYGSAILNFAADINPINLQKVGSVTAAGTTVTGTGTLFLSDVRVGDYIRLGATNVRRVTAVASNVSLTVDSTVTVTGEAYFVQNTGFYEPINSPLVFPMPSYAVKSVRAVDNTIDTSYTVQQRFTGSTNGSGVVTFAVAGGNDTFASEALTANYVSVDNTTGAIVAPTSIVRNSPTNTQVTLTFGAGYASRSFTTIAAVNKTGSGTEKTKTLAAGQVTVTTQTTAQAKTVSLAVADGFALVNVLMDTGTFASPTGVYTTDITSRYSFSDGQTDSFYGLASVNLIDGQPAPTAPIRINFQYFTHSVTGDYFTVNSYLSTMAYDQIPFFGKVALRDCIDFRPRVDNTGADFVGTGAVANGIPKRGVDVQADYSFYLGRKDKLVLASDGTFYDVPGVSATNPVEPNDPSTGMVLFKINLEPYTFNVAKGSVVVETIDNKRYTMRDIGRIEKRVDNLEYYTSLSLLEQETKSLTIPDSTGLDRFKNGFIVDSFNGHGIGNTSSPDYMCAVDMENNVLRPFYSMANVTLFEQNTSDAQRTAAGYQVTGDVVTLPYSSVTMISQPYASRTENVNPFAIFSFVGRTELNPSSDEWFDTYRLPDIVTNVDGNFNTITTLAEGSGVLGTVWNAWQTQWTGASTSTGSTLSYGVHTSTVWDNGVLRQRTGDELTNMARTVVSEIDATVVGQSRTGVQTSVVSKVDTVVTDDKVVSSAVIPYIRSRNLMFLVRGLKPNTRFYPFFDGTAISAYVTPSTTIGYTAVEGFGSTFDFTQNVGGLADEASRQIDGNSDNALDRGDVIYVATRGANNYTVSTSPATAVVTLQEKTAAGALSVKVSNIKGTFQAGDIIIGTVSGARGTITVTPTVLAAGGNLTSNINGDVVGLFQIPNTDAVRFRTGTREFKLSDDANNATTATSTTRQQYSATGILQTKQAYVTATRNAEIVQTQVTDTQTIVQTNQRVISDTGWWDPLAQTFLVQQTDGAFITEVDLYFQSKDDAIPVQIQLRDVVNGYPGKNVLPFSHTVLTPDQVNVSEDASVATTFKLAAPVYVGDGGEYCLVVLSDSNKYNVWISQLGEKVVGSDRFISEQPYAGVLFKSQNASTWTADQLQDLKFTLRRAQFVTGQYGEVVFVNDQVSLTNLPTNAFQFTSGSKKIRIEHRDHGMSAGSTVTIAGLTGTVNGIPSAEINGNRVIADVDLDSYTITVATTNATSSGIPYLTGVTATANVQYDAIQPIVQMQTFTDTTSAFFIKSTSGTSPEGAESPYSLDSAYSPVTINDTNYMSRTSVVASKINETTSMSGSKSLFLKGRLFTNNDSVSPFIDMHRLSVVAVKNRCTAPTNANTNVAVIDDRTVLSANTTIAFSGSTISTADASAKLALKTVNVGRYINIAGSSGVNNADWLVTAVAADGSSITVDGTLTTVAAGPSITLVSRENYVDEIAPVNSSAAAKYVSQRINFANPSTFMRVMFAAAIPPAASVDVYYKLNTVGGASNFDTVPYVKLNSDAAMVKSSVGQFYDNTFSLTGAAPFDAVQVKLVMKSTDSSQVPMIKDLRIIACA